MLGRLLKRIWAERVVAVPGRAPHNVPSRPAGDGTRRLLDIHLSKRGKVSDKWEAYFGVYERVFAPLRDQPVRLLEIGVQNGGSLEVWAAYFARAEAIVGCDIDPLCGQLRYADPRIHVVVGDVSTAATKERVLSIAPTLDVIVDDGSHVSKDIVTAFFAYFPSIRDGGVFVVEDMHAVYRPVEDGGLLNPTSAQEFFKLMADVVNMPHWRTVHDINALLSRFVQTAPPWLSTIESVEFSDSMVVIRKGKPRLGRRLVAGDDARVRARSPR